MKRPIYLLLLFCSFFSCKKDELVTVGDNKPPDDLTISSVKIENYINRTYILSLGREPSALELSSASQSLASANLDSSSRQALLSSVFSASDYLPHVYDLNKIDLLNNVDTAEFSNWINVFSYFLLDTTYAYQWPFLQYELNRLTLLRDAYPLFISGSIALAELQRRMCNNYLYDQINMGSANFVLSTFQHLINRNPTNAEHTGGISMTDGNNATLFLQAGNSKNDYLNILTTTNNYFEGQVVRMYDRFLHRLPITTEMDPATTRYATTQDAKDVMRIILSTDEFAGL